MKKYILFLFVVLLSGILLPSCSNNEKDIVGKWELKSKTFDVKTSDKEAAERIKSRIHPGNLFNNDKIIEFTDDKKLMSQGKEIGTYSISGNKLTLNSLKSSITGDMKVNEYNLTLVSIMLLDDNTKARIGVDDDIKIEKIAFTLTFARV